MPITPINPFSLIKKAIASKQSHHDSTKATTNPYSAQNTSGGLGIADASAVYAVNKNRMPQDVKEILLNFRRTCNDSSIYAKKIKRQSDQIQQLASEITKKAEKSMMPEAEDIQEESGIIFIREQRKYNELLEKFETGDFVLPNGKVIRKITRNSDGSALMEEFSKDGKKLLTCTKFQDGKPILYAEGYREHSDGAQSVAKRVVFKEGKPSTYEEGFEETKDGKNKVARTFEFDDGSLSLYSENLSADSANNSGTIALTIGYKDNAVLWYQEGYRLASDGTEETDLEVRFRKDKTPFLYQQGYKKYSDDSDETAIKIGIAKNGKPIFYQENYSQKQGYEQTEKYFTYDKEGRLSSSIEGHTREENSTEKMAKYLSFNPNSEPACYQEGFRSSAGYTYSIAKELVFTEGKPDNYVKDCEEYSTGMPRIGEYVECDKEGKPIRLMSNLNPDFETIDFAYEKTNDGWNTMSDENVQEYFEQDGSEEY